MGAMGAGGRKSSVQGCVAPERLLVPRTQHCAQPARRVPAVCAQGETQRALLPATTRSQALSSWGSKRRLLCPRIRPTGELAAGGRAARDERGETAPPLTALLPAGIFFWVCWLTRARAAVVGPLSPPPPPPRARPGAARRRSRRNSTSQRRCSVAARNAKKEDPGPVQVSPPAPLRARRTIPPPLPPVSGHRSRSLCASSVAPRRACAAVLQGARAPCPTLTADPLCWSWSGRLLTHARAHPC